MNSQEQRTEQGNAKLKTQTTTNNRDNKQAMNNSINIFTILMGACLFLGLTQRETFGCPDRLVGGEWDVFGDRAMNSQLNQTTQNSFGQNVGEAEAVNTAYFVPPERFDAEFQLMFVRCVVQNSELMRFYADKITADDVELPGFSAILHVAVGFFQRTGQLMDVSQIGLAVAEEIRDGKIRFLPEWKNDFDCALMRIQEPVKPGEVEFIRDKLPAFLARLRFSHWQVLHSDSIGRSIAESETANPFEELIAIRDGVSRMKGDDKSNRYTLSDLQAYQPDPSDFLVGNGFIRRGGGTLLTGGTGLGKSVLAMQFAIGIAVGKDILNILRVERPFRVLVLQAENDAFVLKRDVTSIIRHTDANPVLVQRNLVIHHLFGVNGKDFGAQLGQLLAVEKPDLVVIDPYQAYVGGIDINSSQPFLNWIKPVEAAIKKAKCALLLVVHTTKPRERGDWNARENVYMAAGTSALANWCRASAELMPAGRETERFRLTFGKNAESHGINRPDLARNGKNPSPSLPRTQHHETGSLLGYLTRSIRTYTE